jgi:2-oxoglutarate dehydrogenase E2 component (dihydrolipoamide succinyltransferase)
MLTEVRAPKIEPSDTKPSIGRWFKRVGEPVTVEEPLVEIETRDQTIEVKAPVSGVLSQVYLKEGEYLTPNMALGVITTYD